MPDDYEDMPHTFEGVVAIAITILVTGIAILILG